MKLSSELFIKKPGEERREACRKREGGGGRVRCVEHVFTTRDDRLRPHGCFPRNHTLNKRTEEYNVKANELNKEGVLSRTDTWRKERLVKRVKHVTKGTSVSTYLSRSLSACSMLSG